MFYRVETSSTSFKWSTTPDISMEKSRRKNTGSRYVVVVDDFTVVVVVSSINQTFRGGKNLNV